MGNSTSRLERAAGAVHIAFGLAFFQFPQEYSDAVYDPVRPYLPYLAVLFMVAGIVLLRPYAAFGTGRRWLKSLVGGGPLLVLAALKATGALWTGLITLGLLGLGALLAPWLERPARSGSRDLFSVVAGLVLLLIGGAFVLAPHMFSDGSYALLWPYLRGIGLVGVAGAVLQWLAPPAPAWAPWLWRLPAAVPPALLSLNFVGPGVWTGVIVWGVLATMLLAGRVVPAPGKDDAEPELAAGGGEAQGRACPAAANAAFLLHTERAIESWSWLLSLFIALLSAVAGSAVFTAPRFAEVFTWAVYGYNVLVHHALSRSGTPAQRVRWHLVFFAVLSGLLHLAGGPAGTSYLALLAAIPALGAQAYGEAAGRRLFGLASVVVVLSALGNAAVSGQGAGDVWGTVGLHLAVLFLGAGAAMRGAGELRQQRQEAQQALAAAEQSEQNLAMLTDIMEASPAFVGMADDRGQVVYLNPAGRRMLGLTGEVSMVGRSLTEGHPSAVGDMLLNEALPAAARDGTWQGETVLLTADHREVPVLQMVVAHPPQAGRPAHFSTIAHDITARKELEAQLRHEAAHDSLTGLPNRRQFQTELDRQLAAAAGSASPLTLMLLDLDGFKYVNDRLGHHAGDRLLQQLAQLLRRQMREDDLVARLGGDEFAFILPGLLSEDAVHLAARTLEAIGGETFLLDGHPVSVTASIGLSCAPEHGARGDDLFAHADIALYQAKGNGKNGYAVFSPDLHWKEKLGSHLDWEGRIREALGSDGLFLACQPIWDLHTGQTVMHELLLRMHGPDGEVIPPGAFLGVAEESGLIHQLDRWVARRAIAMAAAREAEGWPTTFAFNVSGRTFGDPEFLPLIEQELARTGVDGRHLVVEITETAAVGDADQVRAFIEALKRHGCRFAIDDFGAGFTSFGLLRGLPVDYLKIDGTFINELASNPVDRKIVRGMAAIARGLRMEVIAEQVGDADSVDFLRKIGVDFGQGFYLGRPKPVSQCHCGLGLEQASGAPAGNPGAAAHVEPDSVL